MAKDNKSEKVVEAAEEKHGTSAVAVYNKLGGVVRTYSAAVHGEKFVDLAEEYAKKIGGTVKKAG